MSIQKETKINQILQKLPIGAVATTKWLRSMGFGLNLISKYVKTGWFERLGTGAVARRGRKVEWQGGVYALQSQLDLSLHPGGKTALGLLGSLHFIPLHKTQITLFYHNREQLPEWFSKHDWCVQLQLIRTDLFGDSDESGMTEIVMGDFALKVSSHERAMLEYLYLLDNDNPGDEPVKIMETLAWLRPEVVQEMLGKCRSVKVKRLFIVLGQKVNHAWFSKLDLKRVDIGKGKRQFYSGGVLHPQMKITIPKSWNNPEVEQ